MSIGKTVLIKYVHNGFAKEYTIVGHLEANPLARQDFQRIAHRQSADRLEKRRQIVV
ncbi:MAG: GreA/GreB family elongation factor [Bacillus subtilis]|nr:GreA/GreB family elongation factor [Bacillus subtilis]